MTQNIIVDSCGWVAIIDASINFESELERMFGSYNLILIDLVEHELQDLENDRPKRRSLLLDLLKQKSIGMKSASPGHTDDLIFELASQDGYSVLTIDRSLKKRLYQSGICVVEVAKNKHLKMIEGL